MLSRIAGCDSGGCSFSILKRICFYPGVGQREEPGLPFVNHIADFCIFDNSLLLERFPFMRMLEQKGCMCSSSTDLERFPCSGAVPDFVEPSR